MKNIKHMFGLAMLLVMLYGNIVCVMADTGVPITEKRPEQYLQEEDLCDVTFSYIASFSNIDFERIKLILYNNDDNVYYDIPYDDIQDDLTTKLPAGTYSLAAVWYDDYPNQNYKTSMEKFVLDSSGITDTQGENLDGVIIQTEADTITQYYRNVIFQYHICGDTAYTGSLHLKLKGHTDLKNPADEVYSLDGDSLVSGKTGMFRVKSGTYYIDDIQLDDGWYLAMDTSVVLVGHRSDVERSLYLYKDLEDLPTAVKNKIADGSYTTTQENVTEESVNMQQDQQQETEQKEYTEPSEEQVSPTKRKLKIILGIILFLMAAMVCMVKV